MSEKIMANGVGSTTDGGTKSSVWKTLFKWWAYLAPYWNNTVGASYLPAIGNMPSETDQSVATRRHSRLRGHGGTQLMPSQYRMLATGRAMPSVTLLPRQINDLPNVSAFFTALANDGKLSAFNCKVYNGLISMEEIGCKAARAMASLLAITQQFQTVVVAESCDFTLDEEKQGNGLYSIRYHLKCSDGGEKSFGVYDVTPDVLDQLRLGIYTPDVITTAETMSSATGLETLADTVSTSMAETESITSSTEVSTANIESTTEIEEDNTTPEITTMDDVEMTTPEENNISGEASIPTEDTTMVETDDNVGDEDADTNIVETVATGPSTAVTDADETLESEDASHESATESRMTTVANASENTSHETVGTAATTAEQEATRTVESSVSSTMTDGTIPETWKTVSTTSTVATDETLTSHTDTENVSTSSTIISTITSTEDKAQSATDRVTTTGVVDQTSTVDNNGAITTSAGEGSTTQTQETVSTASTAVTTGGEVNTEDTHSATEMVTTKDMTDRPSIPDNVETVVISDPEYTIEDEDTDTKGLPKAAGYSMSTVAGIVLGAGMACMVEQCCYGKIKATAKVAPVKQNSAEDSEPSETKPNTTVETKPDTPTKTSDIPSARTIALRKSILEPVKSVEPKSEEKPDVVSKVEEKTSNVAPLLSVRLSPLDEQFVQQIEDKLLLN